jgi:hypothetical protein
MGGHQQQVRNDLLVQSCVRSYAASRPASSTTSRPDTRFRSPGCWLAWAYQGLLTPPASKRWATEQEELRMTDVYGVDLEDVTFKR